MHAGDVIQGIGLYLKSAREVRRSNTDSSIAALYILLDSSGNAFYSV